MAEDSGYDKPQRHLITVQTMRGVVLHGYLVCRDREQVDRAIGIMFDFADAHQLQHLNIVLDTLLDTGSDLVEAIVRRKLSADASTEEVLRSRKRTRFIAWVMVDEDPDNRALMELH